LRSNGRWLRALAVVTALGLVAVGCSKKSGGGKTVKIAFVGALTGANAQLVLPGYQGAKLAIDQANDGKFGDLPVTIELVQEDTQGSGTVIPPIATKIANDQSFVGVIGPAFSGESLAGGPTFDQAGIPFVTGSATKTAINQNGWTHWFRANANDDEQGPAAGNYIARIIKPGCAFVTSDDSPYGQALAAIVQTTISSAGVPVTAQINAVPTSGGATHPTDFSALITKISSSACGAVFYGGYSPEAGLLSAQMVQAGVSAVLVGGDGIKDTTFTSEAKDAGQNTVATCPCVDITKSTSPGAQTFISDYKDKWSKAPGIYSAEYYDIARMYIEGLKAGKTTRDGLTQYLDSVAYTGLTKDYRFQPNHELDPENVKIYYWKDVNRNWSYLGLDKDVLAST
jgi:branched-chain amino acid transport system substrate-binding protein